MSYELLFSRVVIIERVTSYELLSVHELRVSFCIRITSYCLLDELRVNFCIRVTSYCSLHELRVTFIERVTSFFFLFELQVFVCCTSYIFQNFLFYLSLIRFYHEKMFWKFHLLKHYETIKKVIT